MAHDDLIARADGHRAYGCKYCDAGGECLVTQLAAEVARLQGERDQARTELEEFQRGVYNMGATHRRRIDT